jgi:hypothetical protein
MKLKPRLAPFLAGTLLLLPSPSARTQETPTERPILESSWNTTPCAEPAGPFTEIRTALKDPSASRPPSPWSNTSLARKSPGSVTVFGCPGEEMTPPNAKAVMFDAEGA